MARKILPPFSYEAMREFEVRRRRIDTLFEENGPIWCAIRVKTPFGELSKEQMGRLMAGYKRALMLVDRVVDCAAEVIYHEHQDYRQRLEPSLAKKRKAFTTALTADRKAHWAMRRYIQSWTSSSSAVSRIDLAYLHSLGDILFLTPSLPSEKLIGDMHADVPPIVRMLAVQEMVLRYGSAGLWIWLAPRYETSKSQSWGAQEQAVDGEGEGEGEAELLMGEGTWPRQRHHPLSIWFAQETGRVLGEMRGFENGNAARAKTEEDDDGRAVLPGLASILSQVVEERFFSGTGDTGGHWKSSPSLGSGEQVDGGDEGDEHYDGDRARVHADHVRNVVLVKILVDVGYCRF